MGRKRVEGGGGMKESSYHDIADDLAERHVEWLMKVIIPIVRIVATEEFIHGYKHGLEDKESEEQEPHDRYGGRA